MIMFQINHFSMIFMPASTSRQSGASSRAVTTGEMTVSIGQGITSGYSYAMSTRDEHHVDYGSSSSEDELPTEVSSSSTAVTRDVFLDSTENGRWSVSSSQRLTRRS